MPLPKNTNRYYMEKISTMMPGGIVTLSLITTMADDTQTGFYMYGEPNYSHD